MELSELLGRDGPLARQIPGFAPRPQQIRLAEAVADTLEKRGVLIAEAGTGTGKTYAYLVPALLSGQRVIVSTGTRALQDQLFHKDLPLVRRALGVPVRVALLKGRGNYLCRQRLALTEAAGRFPSRQQAAEFARIRDWAGRTERGDIAEVPGIPETSPLWARVTSSADNCLGQNCPHFEQCHVLRARREAQEADLLVINHHLFCADMVIREEGFAELLPGADAFILDEAHQLPEVAGQFFGLTLSSRQLIELARDSLAEQLRDAPEFKELGEHCQRLERACAVLRLALGEEDGRRAAWHEVAALPAVVEALAGLDETLGSLRLALKEAAPRGTGLESCWSRCEVLLERLRQLGGEPDGDGNVHWFETQGRSFSLSLTPLDIAPLLRERMARYQAAWVFTSATLAIGDDFRHFAASLGLGEAQTLRLESPFDYARNALLYHPEGLPDPASPYYGAAVVETVLPVLEASRGRAFLLFTSHQALQEAAERLKGRTPYPLLVQGELPKGELLARFRALGNAVLLGTASFWEGVDVRGEALSCVVIAKLPFSSPGDPLEQARIEALRRQGGNPFLQYQVPQAVIALKQGAGRLIRDVSDRGVLMLCDPRILTKPYGRLFLDSLPPMTRTRKLERVRRFFALADIR
ncbi:MAG TPA: ATP-dependent DNA helicase [Candidatus Competibacteraceae bacterium]|nr:ATP-dependent DNA helicase [Candidatus Competibacteraceae bacterium]